MSDTSLPPPSAAAPTGLPADGLAPPPLPPLPPNLPHDSLKNNIIISSTICWCIALLFVILRFYTRGVLIKVLGWPDWSILAALVFAGATCGAVIEQALRGSGRHIWDLDPNDTKSAIAWGKAAWLGILFYLVTICFSKVSILLLYIHLFSFKWARLAGQILLGFVILVHVYMAVTAFTACIPLQSYWDFRMQKNYCHAQGVWWSNTALHMATDYLIFLLPMPVVWSIQLPRRQKLALSGVFGFGFLVCFISILRLLQLIRAQKQQDWTYAAAELSYLTAVEVNGAIVCACVMTLKPFVARFFPGLLSSRTLRSTDSVLEGRRARANSSPVNPAEASPMSVLDKQYGIHRDGYHQSESRGHRNWNPVAGGVGGGGYHHDRYVEIDDKMPVVVRDADRDSESPWTVDVEMAENAGRSQSLGGQGGAVRGPAHDARRDYMLRRGIGSGPVPEGVVRVETSVTVTKERKR